jgi:hypothetical protein
VVYDLHAAVTAWNHLKTATVFFYYPTCLVNPHLQMINFLSLIKRLTVISCRTGNFLNKPFVSCPNVCLCRLYYSKLPTQNTSCCQKALTTLTTIVKTGAKLAVNYSATERLKSDILTNSLLLLLFWLSLFR